MMQSPVFSYLLGLSLFGLLCIIYLLIIIFFFCVANLTKVLTDSLKNMYKSTSRL